VLGEGEGENKGQKFDENKGIVIIGANCLMRMVNEVSDVTPFGSHGLVPHPRP
jgi:hypothetical protein